MTEDEARAWLTDQPDYDRDTEERLEAFSRHLAEENRVQNLVSQGSMDKLWSRHIVDSAQLLDHVTRETDPWLDLGAGAGFPGLIIAIMRPHNSVVLVESRARRIEWLLREVEALGLSQVRVEGSPLELIPAFRAAVISARAFAPLDRLLALAARFSDAATLWRLPKGRSAADELALLRRWEHTFHVEPSLTDPDAGIIIGSLIRQIPAPMKAAR